MSRGVAGGSSERSGPTGGGGRLRSQLARVVRDLEAARDRLHDLVDTLPDERWARRPAPGSWSVAECVEHLNLTGRAYVPVLRDALDEARRLGGPSPERYRRDFVGWLLWAGTGPVPRVGRLRFGRIRTSSAFVPRGELPPGDVVREFDRLQDEQIALARASDGLPLASVKIVSPFDSRLRYNVYSCLVVLPRHQERHLAQAERAAEA